PALLGPVVGPPLGGLIVTVASWRWVFLINIPIAAIGLFLVNRHIPDVRGEGVARLGVRGFFLAAFALAGLAVGLGNLGPDRPPPQVTAMLTAAGFAFSGLYWLHARRRAQPILEPSPFRIATFRETTFGGMFV